MAINIAKMLIPNRPVKSVCEQCSIIIYRLAMVHTKGFGKWCEELLTECSAPHPFLPGRYPALAAFLQARGRVPAPACLALFMLADCLTLQRPAAPVAERCSTGASLAMKRSGILQGSGESGKIVAKFYCSNGIYINNIPIFLPVFPLLPGVSKKLRLQSRNAALQAAMRGRVKGARAPSGIGCIRPLPLSCRCMARAGATQSSKASIGNMRQRGRCMRLATCCQRAPAEVVYRGPYRFAEAGCD
jgi:hypothetical protein